MNYSKEDKWVFKYIMATSFTENEIEHLENAAEWYFDYVERKGAFTILDPLILDRLAEYDEEEGGEN